MTVRKDGQAKVWLVLASLIMIFAGMSGILSNTLGVFFSAMVEDMGFRTGDLSIYYMIKSLVGAAAVTAVQIRIDTGFAKFLEFLDSDISFICRCH